MKTPIQLSVTITSARTTYQTIRWIACIIGQLTLAIMLAVEAFRESLNGRDSSLHLALLFVVLERSWA